MPKPVTTNEQIAQGIAEVLKQENIPLQELKKKVPRRFWDKVRAAMGKDPPDKGTMSARWNRPSSGPEIRRLVESWLSSPDCCCADPTRMTQETSLDETCDPHLLVPCADIEADPLEDLDPSLVVDLDAEDLVSMGVMMEPLDTLDTCDFDATDSVELYGREVGSLVDTIDIETETWPLESSMVSDETIAVVNELQKRLSERLENLAQELETKLILRLQTLAEIAVKQAIADPIHERSEPRREECPVAPKTRAKRGSRKVALHVTVDVNLFDLFDAECRLRYHGNATQAMNAILWQHYEKPKLSFESEISADPKSGPQR